MGHLLFGYLAFAVFVCVIIGLAFMALRYARASIYASRGYKVTYPGLLAELSSGACPIVEVPNGSHRRKWLDVGLQFSPRQ